MNICERLPKRVSSRPMKDGSQKAVEVSDVSGSVWIFSSSFSRTHCIKESIIREATWTQELTNERLMSMTFNLTGKSNAVTFVVAYGPTDTVYLRPSAVTRPRVTVPGKTNLPTQVTTDTTVA